MKLYKATGEVEDFAYAKGAADNLERLQAAVGGYIEAVYCGDKIVICNEDGKAKKLLMNPRATHEFGSFLGAWDFFCGDVLVTDAAEFHDDEEAA